MIMINLIVRSVDFIYDVILSKYIGAEGLGLFLDGQVCADDIFWSYPLQDFLRL